MIDGLKPYTHMKDSGVAWLGELPQHWPLQRMKTLLCERVQKGFPDEPLLAATQSQGVVRKERYENRTVLALKDLHLLKLVRVGDFVISLRSFQGGIEYAHEQGIISPAYTILYAKFPEMHGYLARLFKSAPYVENLSLFVTGIRQGQNIDYEKLSRAEVPVPPLAEQAAIVRFLDHADRRIRSYIRAKQKLIKLLEEQKQAIIHRAVTRGLDPNVRLKPSGVEWLGEVPEHWEVVPFKRRVGFQEGPGIMAADFRDDGVPLLRISCLQGQMATLTGCNFLDSEMVRRRWSHFAVRPGDYLLSASASTGNVVLATEQVAGAIPYTGILRLWPISNRAFMPFVRLYMRCRPFQEQIDAAKSGVAIEHFGPTHLKRMWIALPPVVEQQGIMEFIDSEVAPFASATDRAAAEIALLREYRTRLIADVVTGKLDVREAAARLPEPEAEVVPDIAEAEDDEEALEEAA